MKTESTNPFMAWETFDKEVIIPTKVKHERLLKASRLNAVEQRELARLENILAWASDLSKMISIMVEACEQVELFLHRTMPIISSQADPRKTSPENLLKIFESIEFLNTEYNRIITENNGKHYNSQD